MLNHTAGLHEPYAVHMELLPEHKRAAFVDTMRLPDGWHVEDVRFYQSVLARILGVGRITVMSHDDTTPKLMLRGLPNPRPLFDTLKQRIIAVKRQRGVVKMDTGG